MGQSVVSLMYGARGSGLSSGLFDDCGEPIWDQVGNCYSDPPYDAYEGDCVGYRVASGPAHDDDEGDLGETCLLLDAGIQHKKYLKNAKNRWDKFSAWMLKHHQAVLPVGSLILTTDERA